MKEYVVLIDKQNNVVGKKEKLAAHVDGDFHRAFSIFIFNSNGELMLQRRALGKYHCGGLWSNTTCSHPRPDETYEQAIHRRILEEMGFDCPMEKAFSISYTLKCPNDLIENELDTIFIGNYDDEPVLNPEEAMDYKWITLDELKKQIKKQPEKFTPWLPLILKKLKS